VRTEGGASAPGLRIRQAIVEVATVGDAALVTVAGTIDERFRGFGELPDVQVLVLDVSGIAFITSFGVSKWITAMKALPAKIADVYLVGCTPIFVEQLNMILHFGGRAQILSLQAPYVCTKCGNESVHTIDVVADSTTLAKREAPPKVCLKCGEKLELDETGELYFACLGTYGPKHLNASATQLLAMDTRKQRKRIEQPPPAALAAVGVADESRSIARWIIAAVVLLAAATAVVFALVT
jgi:hypothetical protein